MISFLVSFCLFVFFLFACFIELHFFLNTASFPACYDLQSCGFFNELQTPWKSSSSYCLSLLAHRIINAWLNSGPDLQSAPTPWMLDASAPIGGSQLLLACFACLVLGARLVRVSVWWRSCYLCLCVIGLSQQRFQCTMKYVWYCGHFTVCAGLPQFLMCSTFLPPLVAQTLLIFSTQTDFNPNVVCP